MPPQTLVPGTRVGPYDVVSSLGTAPRRMRSCDDQLLFRVAISRDGALLAVARGPRLRDAQLLTGFEPNAATAATTPPQ